MARRCARWRIHCEPPSWLRPRREVAPPLPSFLMYRGVRWVSSQQGNFLHLQYLGFLPAEQKICEIALSLQRLTDCRVR
jgi:hypothetical protein